MLTPLLSLISSQDVLRPSISSFTAKIIFIFVPSTFFSDLRALAVASFGVRHIAGYKPFPLFGFSGKGIQERGLRFASAYNGDRSDHPIPVLAQKLSDIRLPALYVFLRQLLLIADP